ncbi:hypothetical protein [Pelosinus sp. sgz500959]|uniref:hypothetical protein n=1 Tax=Pelosinus sp. sgz500959 TaxID=3242472 RepID=UPI003671444E
MTEEELAYEIAKGIGVTSIEGKYGSVTCSTAGDYPSMGISQWEGLNGGRGDTLLSYIDGGDYFAGRTYSDIKGNGEKGDLSSLLDSPQGQEAQNIILAQDCLEMYIPELKKVPGLEGKCLIYAGMWCPTSHSTVRRFLQNRADEYDLTDLEVLRDIFRDQYYIAASVSEENAEGYANRADTTYDYVVGLDM